VQEVIGGAEGAEGCGHWDLPVGDGVVGDLNDEASGFAGMETNMGWPVNGMAVRGVEGVDAGGAVMRI